MMPATAEMPVDVSSQVILGMPDENYHAPVIGVASKSMLDMVNRSPAHYYAAVTGPRKPSTPAQRIGKLVHRYTLELPRALETIAVVPEFGDCRKTENKNAKAQWLAENAGKDTVTADEWEQIKGMGESVLRNPLARRLIEQCQAEVSAFWVDPETGLECKMRADGWVSSLGVILDLKTTTDASPEKFARSCWDWRYHVQNAFYWDGLSIATGTEVRAFRFLAVEKDPPYVVAIYTLDDSAIGLGREQYRANMRTLKQCVETNEWPAFGQSTQTLSLPTWAYRGMNQ